MMRPFRTFLPLVALLAATGSAPAPDDLDTFVLSEMARRQIPGLSLAIVQDGKIVEARAYGVREAGGTRPVTPTTLFQAGSISKSVAALGALHLVDAGKLSLDADVNTELKTWKVPGGPLTATKPVTLRGLLSHTAGLTVHGFPGYAVTAPMPTLVQVLDGAPPANTAPIRVDVAPGSIWRYSGGGYTVMQQMMLDVTGESFPEYMRRTVLEPIGMTNSTYQQPLPAELAARTATGHYQRRDQVEGRWHVYPEMAAAGLWTTPSDLAKFAIEVQRANAGVSSRVITPATARQMLTEQMSGDGLGVFLQDTGRRKIFSHNGRDEGFDASLTATVATGQGLALMINANDDSRMVARIAAFVARKYHWPNASAYQPPAAVAATAATLRSYSGRYEVSNNNMVTLVPCGTQLCTFIGGYPDEELVWLGDGRFASTERPLSIAPVRDSSGAIVALTWTNDVRQRVISRVGPLVADLARRADGDPGGALTATVADVLHALAQGGQAVAHHAALSAGMRRDFSNAGPWPPAAGITAVRFIAAEDVSRRNLVRHDGMVDRIAYYGVTSSSGEWTLLVYLTREGMITDVDDVTR